MRERGLVVADQAMQVVLPVEVRCQVQIHWPMCQPGRPPAVVAQLVRV
jgi:hypothetical protein